MKCDFRAAPLGLFERVYSIAFEPKSLVWYDEGRSLGTSWPVRFGQYTLRCRIPRYDGSDRIVGALPRVPVVS